jgi:hypothetical protein
MQNTGDLAEEQPCMELSLSSKSGEIENELMQSAITRGQDMPR